MLIPLTMAFAVPGLYVRLAHIAVSPIEATLLSGTAIMASAFILLWACDAAQSDISQSLALAIVALIAVSPEYAVDMYFTWMAGKYPDGNYAHYAIANMTGANRLLIGVAWVFIVVINWYKTGSGVKLESERKTEIFFLALATVYAFVIPLKNSLAWYDCIVFISIYAWYIYSVSGRTCEESETDSPAKFITDLPKIPRRIVTAFLFLFACGTILANAEPFSEGLVATGKTLGINEFLLVQWLAPIASETPEFVVAIMFAWRGQAGVALGSLLAAKLNQWTLLVGMIPGVFAFSHNSLEHSLPLDAIQLHEILLTAAQSLLAVIIIANLRLPLRHALLLFFLFAGQLVSPNLVEILPGDSFLGLHDTDMHQVFTLLYVIASLTMILERPGRLARLLRAR